MEKQAKAVASVLLQSEETTLQWVVRRSHTLEHRSVPEFLGVSTKEPGLIYSMEEYSAAELIMRMPVDHLILKRRCSNCFAQSFHHINLSREEFT